MIHIQRTARLFDSYDQNNRVLCDQYRHAAHGDAIMTPTWGLMTNDGCGETVHPGLVCLHCLRIARDTGRLGV